MFVVNALNEAMQRVKQRNSAGYVGYLWFFL